MSRIEAHRARFFRKGNPGEWTEAMMMATLTEHEARLKAIRDALAARSQTPDVLPPSLYDLVRENEPHAEALDRLRATYTQLTNRLVDTRLPALSDEERHLQGRLQRALYSQRKGAVETL